ncbi:HD domain-containing protein [Xylanibacter caecicola]|uniref:HD domain-containing protein n=1 Tax=Xylanibacter caecicola TaxID=2736294 RepID=UPI00258ECE1E|nr:TraI domain-containing protein [Xylanibacter caecicola]
MKDEFISLLKSTGRTGIDAVIDYLCKAGFFEAPASVQRHLSHDGGLLEHSLNVCRVALKLREAMISLKPDVESRLPENSVIIASLLHDVCKTNIYRKNTKYRKNEHGRWEPYEGYDVDYSRFPVGHGEKSVIMLLRLGMELTNDEVVAIRWHMSAWNLAFQSYEDKCNISAAVEGYPLLALIQAADGLAANMIENN